MGSLSQTHDIEFFVRRSPESVRAWWTDLPDDYQATDPKEEPFRIVTLRRFPNGSLLLTYWHNEDQSVRERHEVLVLRGDGGWTVQMTDSPRYHFLDEFNVTPGHDGTYLHLRQTITPKDPTYAKDIPELMKELAEFFREMTEICERDAPEM